MSPKIEIPVVDGRTRTWVNELPSLDRTRRCEVISLNVKSVFLCECTKGMGVMAITDVHLQVEIAVSPWNSRWVRLPQSGAGNLTQGAKYRVIQTQEVISSVTFPNIWQYSCLLCDCNHVFVIKYYWSFHLLRLIFYHLPLLMWFICPSVFLDGYLECKFNILTQG